MVGALCCVWGSCVPQGETSARNGYKYKLQNYGFTRNIYTVIGITNIKKEETFGNDQERKVFILF
jgi:hypothetical protein